MKMCRAILLLARLAWMDAKGRLRSRPRRLFWAAPLLAVMGLILALIYGPR
jgi:hypothetical protein